MPILILESTCDETAAALVTRDRQVLSSVVASQDALHERFHGVVPEIAARAHLERILPVIDEALQRAQISLDQLEAVAVATTPGLAGSLLIGLAAAKTLCLTLNIPLLGVNHLHAHIYACRLASDQDIFPCLGLVVSGGHTSLYRCVGPLNFQLLGGTIDDAAGEAFDKVANLLGLGFPGGTAVARAAESGNPQAYRFPRAFAQDPERLQFSFSGLKTAVRYVLVPPGDPMPETVSWPERQIADVAASFQEAVVDCLVTKTMQALKITRLSRLCVGGGVAANRRLRDRLTEVTQQAGVELHIAPPKLCTDNAVMGAIAIEKLNAGLCDPLDLEIQPGTVR